MSATTAVYMHLHEDTGISSNFQKSAFPDIFNDKLVICLDSETRIFMEEPEAARIAIELYKHFPAAIRRAVLAERSDWYLHQLNGLVCASHRIGYIREQLTEQGLFDPDSPEYELAEEEIEREFCDIPQVVWDEWAARGKHPECSVKDCRAHLKCAAVVQAIEIREGVKEAAGS